VQDIIARSFNGIGPQAEAIMVDVPHDLPMPGGLVARTGLPAADGEPPLSPIRVSR
jgi:hypothetical protein